MSNKANAFKLLSAAACCAVSLQGCDPKNETAPAEIRRETSTIEEPQPPKLDKSSPKTAKEENVIHAAPLRGDSVWRGTIGKAPIALTLRVQGDRVGGRYYYSKHGRSLILSGSHEGGVLKLEERGGLPEKVFGEVLARLNLRTDGKTMTGSWNAAQGGKKDVSIKLKREPKQSYDQLRTIQRGGEKEALGGSFKYESLSSIEEHLVYCRSEEKPPVDVDLIPGLVVFDQSDCHFAFEGPLGARVIIENEEVQITAAKKGLKKAEANRKIALTAEWKPGETWAGSRSTKVLYAGGPFLSLEFSTSGLGLGAYPDHDQIGKTIDLRTSQFITWNDLVESSNLVEIRKAYLAKTEAKNSPDCRYEDVWDEGEQPHQVLPYLSSEGLHVTPVFPHVAKPCQYEAFGLLLDPKLTKRLSRSGGPLSQDLPRN